MRKNKAMNKRNILITYLILSCFKISISMEDREPEKDQTPKTIARILALQKTDKLGEMNSRFSLELAEFSQERAISLERMLQQKENPNLDIDISEVRAQIVMIDLKIAELKRRKDLLCDQSDPGKEKKHRNRRPKKPTMRNIERIVKKAHKKDGKKDTQSLEDNLIVIRRILDKESTEGLTVEDREKLCHHIRSMDIDLSTYIQKLDKKIENVKQQLEQKEENQRKLKIIREANGEIQISPRNKSNTISYLPKKETEL